MPINKPEMLIIHTEAAPVVNEYRRFNIVNDYHKGLDFPKSSLGYYIGYHYFCERDGVEFQARTDTDEGAHTKGQNLTSLSYCLAGNGELALITYAQELKLKAWINRKMKEYGIPAEKVLGHRNFSNKACPGKYITETYLQNLIEKLVEPKPIENTSALKSFIKSLIEFLQEWNRKLGELFKSKNV